jgi:hypothetical protein
MAAEGFMTRECDAHKLARNEELGYAIEWYDDRFEGEGLTHIIDYLEPVTKAVGTL